MQPIAFMVILRFIMVNQVCEGINPIIIVNKPNGFCVNLNK